MSLFQTTVEVKHQQIAKIVKKYWNIQLEKVIKASQNHTFSAISEDKNLKYAVRVTPDPKNIHLQRIKDQIFYVNYLVNAKLEHICPPVKPIQKSENDFILKQGVFIIVVFQWAKGAPLPFQEFKWMTSQKIIRCWGKIFGNMHTISKKFGQQHGEVAKRIQKWDQIHKGVLKGTPIHLEDQKQSQNPEHFGICHGDLNISNIFYDEQADLISAFDTDQVQQGFYLWDVAQAVFSVAMLEQAGFPITGTPVPEANRKFYEQALVEGYESVTGKGSVDRARLERMVQLRKTFYKKFCARAVQEGNIPKDMEAFIVYINKWFQKKKEEK